MELISRFTNFSKAKALTGRQEKKAALNSSVLKEEFELKKAIKNTLTEWKCAVLNFETAESPDMVEHYTYKIKSCEVKYQYLIRQLKTITNEVPDQDAYSLKNIV